MSKAKFKDDRYEIVKPWGSFSQISENTPSGTVRTRFGNVHVMSRAKHTVLIYCIKGKEYWRTYEQGFSRRYLITLANRFAEEKSKEHSTDQETIKSVDKGIFRHQAVKEIECLLNESIGDIKLPGALHLLNTGTFDPSLRIIKEALEDGIIDSAKFKICKALTIRDLEPC